MRTHVKITRQWKSTFTLNSHSLKEIGSITNRCSGNVPALLFENTYACICVAAVFSGEEAQDNMCLVSYDISHLRRFVTMHKLTFELRHRIGYSRVQPSLLRKEHDRTRKTGGNRAFEGDFIPIYIDFLIGTFEVSPSNVWSQQSRSNPSRDSEISTDESP